MTGTGGDADDHGDPRDDRGGTSDEPDAPAEGGAPDGESATAGDGSPATDDESAGPRDDPAGADDGGDPRRDGPRTSRSDAPPAPRARDDGRQRGREDGAGQDDVPAPGDRPIAWYLQTDRPLAVASRDVLSSALLVLVLGLALFAVSGVWPPLVAIESESMTPNMDQGDLVLVVEDDRYTSELVLEDERYRDRLATDSTVLTREVGAETGATRFGAPGDVIVFRPDGEDRTPIIHRAEFYVEEGDRWVDRANPAYLDGAETCAEVDTCPAPHDGYVTRGDANGAYDQVRGQSTVVKPNWIEGRAVTRAPYLGCIRLALAGDGLCG